MGKNGVCSERAQGDTEVELMEGVIVGDGFSRASNELISGWSSCGWEGLVALIPSCLLVNVGGGVS